MKTRQEIFNQVCNHLLTQKEKAINGPACVYLAPDGKQCAVGCLIPKEYYDPEIEGFGLCVVDQKVSVGRGLMYQENKLKMILMESLEMTENDFKENITFLRELQRIHDDNHPDNWAYRLLVFGEETNLEIPEIVKTATKIIP